MDQLLDGRYFLPWLDGFVVHKLFLA